MPYCFVTSTTLSLFLSYLVVNLSSTKSKVYIETLILAGLVPMIWLQLLEEGGDLMRRISWMTGTGRPTPRPSTGPHPPSLGYSRLSVATVVVDTCQLLRDQILCVMRHFLIINLILTSIDKLALTEGLYALLVVKHKTNGDLEHCHHAQGVGGLCWGMFTM